jgi:hypothetical protein
MVPYIVGTLTDFKLKPMVQFLEYMLEIDPDGSKVRDKFEDSTDKMNSYYLNCWKQILFQKEANEAKNSK